MQLFPHYFLMRSVFKLTIYYFNQERNQGGKLGEGITNTKKEELFLLKQDQQETRAMQLSVFQHAAYSTNLLLLVNTVSAVV